MYLQLMKNMSEIILSYVKKNPRQRLSVKELAKKLQINTNEYPAFRDTVKELFREGKLSRFKGNKYGLRSAENEFTGTIDFHPRGFAFVHTPDDKKIYVSEENTGNAAHGDTVAVNILRKGRGKREAEGKVRRVIRRGKNEFICTYHKLHQYSLAIPAIHHLRSEIIIDDMNGFSPEEGEHIIAEVTEWGSGKQRHRGRIKSIVGREKKSEFDAVLIANKYNIPEKFSPETLNQVKAIEFEIPDDDRRRDLRHLECFTIDPEDARDFDDAVSIEHDKQGNYHLGVHIADVSHYVPMNTPVDDDALKRGTSVYFTDFVINMLPEKLSTDLCSLKPGTDRLAMTVIMKVSKNGEVLSYDITSSIIHSRKRFSYEEAQKVIDEKQGPFYEKLITMSRLAKILQKKRHDEGSIDFDLPEPVYELDENGVPVRIRIRERLWIHHIVEEFMLLANQSVANYARTRGTNVPFIYRIHDIPEADSIYEWFSLLDAFGVQASFFGLPVTSKKFQKTLEKVMKQSKSSYIMRTALRTMTKAKYSVKPVGHFGLAFEDYTHFTSPIRRYPDLMVHRLLKKYLRNEALKPEMKRHLKHVAKLCSEAELRALQAEREYHKIKQMRYISTRIGEVFSGTISGVAQHGFWVELHEIFVEGFVHIDTLKNDIWDYDKKKHILKGLRTKTRYQMGEKVNVRVIRTDIKRARADFEIADREL